MKVSNLNKTVKNPNKLSKENKNKLRDVLSSMFDTIERVERNGEIHLKSDREKIDLLKDTIHSMIIQTDREKIIKGDG